MDTCLWHAWMSYSTKTLLSNTVVEIFSKWPQYLTCPLSAALTPTNPWRCCGPANLSPLQPSSLWPSEVISNINLAGCSLWRRDGSRCGSAQWSWRASGRCCWGCWWAQGSSWWALHRTWACSGGAESVRGKDVTFLPVWALGILEKSHEKCSQFY